MPPSAAIHSYGDFSIAAATNPARHGYTKFSLPSNIELNADAGDGPHEQGADKGVCLRAALHFQGNTILLRQSF